MGLKLFDAVPFTGGQLGADRREDGRDLLRPGWRLGINAGKMRSRPRVGRAASTRPLAELRDVNSGHASAMTHIRSRPSRPGSNFSPRMARAGLEELASAPDHQSFGRYHEEQGDQRQYRRHDAQTYHRCKQRKKAGGSDSSDSTGSDSRIIRFWSGIRSPTQTTQTGQRARSSQDPRNARDAAPLTGERKAVDENEDHTGAVKTSIQFTAWAPNLRTTVPPVRSALAIQRPVTMMLPRNTTAPAMWAPYASCKGGRGVLTSQDQRDQDKSLGPMAR